MQKYICFITLFINLFHSLIYNKQYYFQNKTNPNLNLTCNAERCVTFKVELLKSILQKKGLNKFPLALNFIIIIFQRNDKLLLN